VSDWLFAPTETAAKNLHSEGITKGVHMVGDVMYESAFRYAEIAEKRSNILKRFGLEARQYLLATVHRAENTDNEGRLQSIFKALCELSAQESVIWPVHPRTRSVLQQRGWSKECPGGLRMIEPVSYFEMLVLEKFARLVLTDSGGVQKEAYWFRVPCVTLRAETEWVETVEAGWNRLAGSDCETILRAVGSFRGFPDHSNGTAGSGESEIPRAASAIVDELLRSGEVAKEYSLNGMKCEF
jgi:UDP-N-acetylglucosamine 2-epimerase (non-hydrolysing)